VLGSGVRPWSLYASVLALLSGAALIVDSLLRGTAQASIILIVPVLSGNSPEFLIGTLLGFLGLVGVFVTWGTTDLEAPPEPGPGARGAGGVVLIGPVPIFFGEWKAMGRRGFWGWVVAGAIATALLALLAAVLWLRG